MTIIAQRMGGKNGIILLQIILFLKFLNEGVQCQLQIDCDKLR